MSSLMINRTTVYDVPQQCQSQMVHLQTCRRWYNG